MNARVLDVKGVFKCVYIDFSMEAATWMSVAEGSVNVAYS